MSQQNLEIARTALLDLGLRNNFINSKPTKKTIKVIEESSLEIFKILVDEPKQMTFQSRGEDTDLDTEFSALYKILPTEEVDKALLTDTILQTSHPPEELQQRLRSIDRFAKLSLEEKGVNMLYLALGFIRWIDSDPDNTGRFAPVVLLPVELKRNSINANFKISYNQDDIGLNISFLEKLKLEHGIQLELPEEITSENLPAIFEAIENAISPKGWKLLKDDIRLGLFSFSKFLMYNDLNEVNWEEGKKPWDHPLLGCFLGDGFNPAALPKIEADKFGDQVLYSDTYHVLPADSSQQEVIFSIREGLNCVVQGPPGTGKSQTITNIIVDFLARGKKVLFVAEKLAALNVVTNRLEALGLGKLCIELHSNKANKKLFLEELAEILKVKKPVLKSEVLEELQDGELIRKYINEYSDAVNTAIGDSGFTPIQTFGEVLRNESHLKNSIFEIDLNQIQGQSKDNYLKFTRIIQEISGLLRKNGAFVTSPYRMLRPKDYSFYEGEVFLNRIAECLHTLKSLYQDSKNQIVQFTDFNVPHSYDSLLKFSNTIAEINKIEKHFIPVSHISLQKCGIETIESIKSICSNNIEVYSRYTVLNNKVYPKFWELNCFELYQSFLIDSSKWYKFILGRYRRVKNTVRSYLRSPEKISDFEILALLKLGVDYAEVLNLNATIADEIEKISNVTLIDPSENWDGLLGGIHWAENFDARIEAEEVFDFEWTPGLDITTLPKLHLKLPELNEVLMEVEKLLAGAGMKESFSVKATGLDVLIDLFQSWTDHKAMFNDHIQITKNIQDLEINRLNWVLEILENWDLSHQYLSEIFKYYWFKNLARKALSEREILSKFIGSNHNDKVNKFRVMEDLLLKINIFRVLDKHWSNMPNSTVATGKLGVLKKELSKKRKLKPIRTLLEECGEVILDLKPLFLMSPMTVSQFIKGNCIDFDLVVFDEASQIKPVEAFGSILRGKQVVIVGDSKQLPPTSFFDTERTDEEEEDFTPDDVESILVLAQAKNLSEKMLQWHYRSKHESLISVSNREFYNSELLVFPSAFKRTENLGLKHFHSEGSFYASKAKGGSVNKLEAKLIVQEIIKHASSHPEMTLGVVAFSQSQSKVIEDYLEQELKVNPNPAVENYLYNMHQNERFFVKNLENVQGDERDCIFISVGYGYQDNGKLNYNFGPINKEGGERRLNVLFSRAKSKCVVFSNFKGEELDLSRSNSVGVRVLKAYLNFAVLGEYETTTSADEESDAVFEDRVGNFLKENGFDVDFQVGSAGFKIDIAVKHPTLEDKYILAVECDGTNYHASKIARDRDKSRQIILESLGWKFYRIWSTEWFLNFERESKQLLEYVQRIIDGSPLDEIQDSKNVSQPTINFTNETTDRTTQSKNFKYSKYSKIQSLTAPLHEYQDLHKLIQHIILAEQPIHRDVILSRVMEVTGTRQAGTRILSHFDSELNYAMDSSQGRQDLKNENSSTLFEQGGFYFYNSALRQPNKNGIIRNRSALSDKESKMEYISPFEIRNAILFLVDSSYGLEKEEILMEVPKYFGFKRINNEHKESVAKNLDFLLREKLITQEGGILKYNLH